MKEFLEFMVRHLVDQPEKIMVATEERDDGLVFRLSVGEGEVGKIIGKEGRTAAALRTLLRAVAAKQGKRALLEIVG
ncbi:MAG: RNA-binding protein [Ignavibacteria bacterium GWA2_55_11]|nr:MAG: RNA-binding protein [Ignavibacteria bacterium GWA2_55_11]OGU47366.1 MAG: RNA-binding protein [Ignavibacteria bacterium GWC2_56_12]OGU74040.1 MAG: RNA-binding protein [Ignavibacteria bacterium RIFCSPLOWO2_02_FULL_55_14]OGU75553.1 MAG: RNA-binding protein [Ignavibacteria bacterium RIFCSPLOWO2_12_FULL_56_21]HAV22481.1 RNA-binding protein [Bacteroidota bacterium]